MRQWGIDPALMCREHLLAEHREAHMIAGTLRSAKKPCATYIAGLTARGLLDAPNLEDRHDTLVKEMTSRGYRHRTPMPPFQRAFATEAGYVCVGLSTHELWRRCRACRLRIPEALMGRLLAQFDCRNDPRCLDRMERDFVARPTDPETTFAVAPAS